LKTGVKMPLISTHNHSTGSDGKLTPEEIIKKAIHLGWSLVCFTDHYPVPSELPTEYYNNFFNEKYIEEVKKLKEKYKDKIKVFFGSEIDWFQDHKDWLKTEISKHDFDYIIGSIHHLKDKTGEYRNMESGKDYWQMSARRFGGTKEYIKEYYNQIKKLVESGLYDCVGHMDYIKVYNKNQDIFSEDDQWYKEEIAKVLDLIKEKKMAIEVNAGGIRKCKVPFPSPWIIKEAKKRDIPITIGLDAHWEAHYDNNAIKEITRMLKEAGYKSIVYFKKRKMMKMEI
jgi:histidinol-phosphatase (PHP family)